MNEGINGSLKTTANGLIRTYQKHGCTKQAIKWIEAKGTLQRKLLGGDSENLQHISVDLYRELAQADAKQNYAPLLQKNIALLECSPSSNSEHYDGQARDLNSQALACLRKGNPAEARPLYEQALKLDTESLGAKNKAIAIYLNNLGHISEQLKDFDQAEKYYQQALLIDKNAPCVMLDVASDYENLGRLYLERGQKATALKNLVAARDSKSQILGADAVEAVDLDRAIAKAKTLEETAQLFKKNSNTL